MYMAQLATTIKCSPPRKCTPWAHYVVAKRQHHKVFTKITALKHIYIKSLFLEETFIQRFIRNHNKPTFPMQGPSSHLHESRVFLIRKEILTLFEFSIVTPSYMHTNDMAPICANTIYKHLWLSYKHFFWCQYAADVVSLPDQCTRIAVPPAQHNMRTRPSVRHALGTKRISRLILFHIRRPDPFIKSLSTPQDKGPTRNPRHAKQLIFILDLLVDFGELHCIFCHKMAERLSRLNCCCTGMSE